MDKYISDLLELIKAHPELPIVPMVDSEIVCDDGCARWMGAWGPASVTKGKSQENIRDIIMQAVEAGRISAERTAKDAFKATERRLYGLPTLKIKLEDDLERLEEFKLYGPRERSKSITRFVKNGNRLTPDEIWEAVLMDMEATIAADRYEIETLERALATVRDDPYYRALSGKYLDDVDDRDIAEALECDTSTVWRHRKRLVQRVAVWLYGAEALR